MKNWVFALAIAAALTGCAEDGTSQAEGPCVESGSMCATVHVPSGYAHTPVKIIVGLYEMLPPKTPPIDVATVVEAPAIGDAMPVEIEALEMTTSGDYFVYVALYNEGGGNFVPVAGVDFAWESDSKLSVGNAPVNLGDITVELVTETQ